MRRFAIRFGFATALLAIAITSSLVWAQDPLVTDAGAAARIAWWRDAKFGLFIHWGLYAIPARGEWVQWNEQIPVDEYAKLAGQFHPDKFDADAWAAIAKAAGMKYIVITSKHHDGFGMFRSDLTDWCIKSTPFQRDPLKELAAACKDAGLKLCFYHSIMDWHHPDWGTRRAWNDKATVTPVKARTGTTEINLGFANKETCIKEARRCLTCRCTSIRY